MYRYVIKRLLQLIPVLLAISFIIFTIIDLTPGDAAALILGDNANEQAAKQLREELGLNDPFLKRYFSYILNVLHGDFGTSYRNGQDVIEAVIACLPYTGKLAVVSMVIAVVLGLVLGVLSAIKQYSLIDNVTLVATLTLTSTPEFLFGLVLLIIFSVKLGLVSVVGNSTSWSAYILPGIAASGSILANLTRMTRSTMLEVIRMDYIRTARAKGTSEKVVIFSHALPNALLPVVTLIGINMGWMLAGSIVIEQVFSIPGIGTLMINSIRTKDTPVVMGCVLFMCFAASIINLITDLVYGFIDPRIKAEYIK